MNRYTPDPIHPNAKVASATQIIKSPRWPFGRDYFYDHLYPKLNQIKTHPRARPLYRIEEIEALFKGGR